MTEMQKLRKMLDERGIEYEVNDTTDTKYGSGINQTKFEYGDHEVSVVFGRGCYGYHKGLLEMWDFDKEKEPEGYLSAEDVIGRVFG